VAAPQKCLEGTPQASTERDPEKQGPESKTNTHHKKKKKEKKKKKKNKTKQ